MKKNIQISVVFFITMFLMIPQRVFTHEGKHTNTTKKGKHFTLEPNELLIGIIVLIIIILSVFIFHSIWRSLKNKK